ncbi:MAG: PD40 domain-containing protein [Gammaproteobacteria bacterium]|nr:PD40 domain-containing protein [Gammaproteobacteria bacterium]NNL00443.1 hypothetical protein [Xanthomonadales bacterium]
MRLLICLTLLLSNIANATVELVATGKVSSLKSEYSPTFDVSSNELVFMRRTPGKFDYTLYTSKLNGDSWSAPKVIAFSGEYRDAAPYFSPDGQHLVFDSRRPAKHLESGSINLWQVTRESDDKWSTPTLLKTASVNVKNESNAGVDEFGPLLTDSGELWFYSFRQPHRGGAYYRQQPVGKPKIEKDLPDPSASTFIAYLTLSKDEKTAVMEGRSKNSRDTDLYFACKKDGLWGPAIALEEINTIAGEGTPFLSADSKWLWFASDRPSGSDYSQGSNIYRVETSKLPIPCS